MKFSDTNIQMCLIVKRTVMFPSQTKLNVVERNTHKRDD